MSPVQISFKDIALSPAIESQIRRRAKKLNQYYNRISSCRVVVDAPQKHQHQGKLFNIKIDVTVPGKELVATRKADEDIYVAIRDAFQAIGRQLEEHARKRHGRVKAHSHVMHGHVVRMVSGEGYGFIEGVDGNDYYFSMTNVHFPAFSQFYVGDAVEFVPMMQGEGRQAHHVIKERHNNHLPVAI